MRTPPVTPTAPASGVQAPSGGWRPWLHSLIAAGIGGAVTSLGAILVSPSSFSFTVSGMEHLGVVALAGAIIPVLALLKQSPLPPTQA
jgi:hypothetical protein